MHKIVWVIASLFLREDPDEEGEVSAGSQDQAACLEGGVTWGEEGRAGARSGLVLLPHRAHSLGAERWDKPTLLPLERRPLKDFRAAFKYVPCSVSHQPFQQPSPQAQQGRPQSSLLLGRC